MATPEELLASLGTGLGGGANAQAMVQLLQVLDTTATNKRNSKNAVTGDVLKEQTERKKLMADSYAPGTKYEAGFEPAGVFDALSAFSKELGGRGFEMDPNAREINPQHLEDMGSSIGDALDIMRQITDANGEDNSVRDSLLAALTEQLLPKPAAEMGGPTDKTKRATGALSGKTGDADMGVGGTAATPGPKQSIKPPLGKAGEPKGAKGESAGSRILGNLSDLVDGLGIPNPFTALPNVLPGMQSLAAVGGRPAGNGASDSVVDQTAGAGFSPDATAALVAQIMQRASGAAPNAGKDKKKWGANTPGSKHPTGYAEGSQVFEGPTMIRVGERPAGDKKYATEEVVYAAPGTIVAPVPKGLENPTEEEAAGLVITQLLKAQKNPKVAKDLGVESSAIGSITNSASRGRENALNAGLQLTNMRMGNKNQHLDRLQRDTQMRINERSTNRGLDLQGTQMNQTYDLGLRNWMSRNREADQNYDLGKESNSINRTRAQNDFSLGNRNLDLTFQRNQEEFRNWQAERDLKRELGMRGLDIDKQRADQSYQLDSAQMAFQQIMAGITGSALPGVRAGRTPQLSLLG